MLSVANPRFPRGGANLLFSQISLKTAWKWRNLDGGGRASKILLCRSATGFVLNVLYYQNWDIAVCCHSDDYCTSLRNSSIDIDFHIFHIPVPVKIRQKWFVSCLEWESVTCTNVVLKLACRHTTIHDTPRVSKLPPVIGWISNFFPDICSCIFIMKLWCD